MLPIAAQGHAHGVDRFHRAHGVALDAGYLDQPADRVAGQTQVVFHADLGGVLHLLHGAAHDFAQGAGSHRAGHAHLALAADFGAGDGGVLLVENADCRRREQKPHHPVFAGARYKAHVVVQHRRDDASGAIGRRGDHTPAVGVFLVYRQCVEIDPVEHRQGIAQAGFRVLAELSIQCRCPALDLEPTRQDAFMAVTGLDTILHHLPDTQQAGAGLGLWAPGRLVGEHHLAD
ncbi:hypothetical protein D3C81_1224000 [compost metagenome]